MKISKGFTIIELIISVAIFTFMTAFLVAKYGAFNQSLLLTNLAYDVALTIRNAQTYGLNVKSRPTANAPYTGGETYDEIAAGYLQPYGVHFDTKTGTPPPRTQIIFFADKNGNGIYNPTGDELITRYTLRGGSYVSDICIGTSEGNCSSSGVSDLDILFKRPDPAAYFGKTPCSDESDCRDRAVKYTVITLSSQNGQTKKVAVRSTGQIAVLQDPEPGPTGTYTPSPSGS